MPKVCGLDSDQSDFFRAPGSTMYHSNYPGGLCEHSLNVYHCLVSYLKRDRVKELYKMSYSDESIAIVSLLHDLCKVNIYKEDTRNVKDENGVWQKVPCYKKVDDLPYGHGEKSQYIVAGFMKLTREESFAIRFHMGFSNVSTGEELGNVGKSFQKFPLSFALSTADMEATYFLE
jgi:hypothetical protein